MHLTFTCLWNNYWLTIVTTNKNVFTKKNVMTFTATFSSRNIYRKKAKLPYLWYIVIILYTSFGQILNLFQPSICVHLEKKTNNRHTTELRILYEINLINLKTIRGALSSDENKQKAGTKVSTVTAIAYYQNWKYHAVTTCGTVKWKFPRWIYDYIMDISGTNQLVW